MEKKPIPRATAESVGIPSSSIITFLNRILEHKLNLHSLLVIRSGKIVAEGYWAPFDKERKHRLYSVSKSITALAIGYMIDEGKISLDDHIVDFFPEKVQEPPNPRIINATIHDMLIMSDCHDDQTYRFDQEDWIDSWFTTDANHMPGKVFSYNTTCTNLLTAIVERVSGMKLLNYLRPVFDAIGVSDDIWCIETPEGYSFGGSGVMATPRDLAKIALLVMNKGKHEGEQLISQDFIQKATSKQIDNYFDFITMEEDIEHQQGYGYQIWRTRNNGFSFYGMGSQLAICLPDKELIVVTTGDTQGISPDTSEILSALWETLYHDICEDSLPEDPKAQEELINYMSNLALPVVEGDKASCLSEKVNGKTYVMNENPMGIKDVCFSFHEDEGTFTYTTDRGIHRIDFGFGYNKKGDFPETHYSGTRIGTPKNTGYEMHASAAWCDEKTLLMVVYITDDYLGSLKMYAVFDGESIQIAMKKRAEAFLEEYHGYADGSSITTKERS